MAIDDLYKAAIISFQSHNRVVQFLKSTNKEPNERLSLINAISEVYAKKLCGPLSTTRYILQWKEEEWGGALVDFFDDIVPYKSVFKLILEVVSFIFNMKMLWLVPNRHNPKILNS